MIITRISRRAGAGALAAAVTAVLLSGCAGETNGIGTVATRTAGAAVTTDFPTTTVALANLLTRGTLSIHTVHMAFTVMSQSLTIRAEGDEILENGRTHAASITEDLGRIGTLRLIISEGKTYVMLPKSERTSPKPWALVSASSSNSIVRAIAGSTQAMSSLNSPDVAATFVTATEKLDYLGTAQLDGTRVAHYRLRVDVSKLPSDFPQKSTLLAAGLNMVPIDLWVDAQGRARKVTESVSVGGVTADTSFTMGSFDAPVSISAPPPDQVSTD